MKFNLRHTNRFIKRMLLIAAAFSFIYTAFSYFVYYSTKSRAGKPDFIHLASSRSDNRDIIVVSITQGSNLNIQTLRLDFTPQEAQLEIGSVEKLSGLANGNVVGKKVGSKYSVTIAAPLQSEESFIPKGVQLVRITLQNNNAAQKYSVYFRVNGSSPSGNFDYIIQGQSQSGGVVEPKAKYVLTGQRNGRNIDIFVRLCSVSRSFNNLSSAQISLQYPKNRVSPRGNKVIILNNNIEFADAGVLVNDDEGKIAGLFRLKNGKTLNVNTNCVNFAKFIFSKSTQASGNATFSLRKGFSFVYIKTDGQDKDILDRSVSTGSVNVNLSDQGSGSGQNQPTNTPTSTFTPTPTPNQSTGGSGGSSGGGSGSSGGSGGSGGGSSGGSSGGNTGSGGSGGSNGGGATGGSTSGNTVFRIAVKFQGINGLSRSGVREMPVKVGLQRVGSSSIAYKTVNFRVKEDGVWVGEVSYNVVGSNIYFMYIKGPKHIGKKICEVNPREGYPGAYRCPQARAIRLEAGKSYNFDFSKITLLVGDLPQQDGLVNSYDIALVRNLLGKTDADSLSKADVNLDGIVDTQDFALIQAALSVRYDDY